jgi:D-glycero-D-manno-heptose 1,7-bisphosphate phosphatase
MILQGIKDFNADMEESFVVGDSQKDVDAAAAAGLKGFLYMGGDIADFIWQVVKANFSLIECDTMPDLRKFEALKN